MDLTMNAQSRIRMLRQRMLRKPEICTQRAYYLTESYRMTQGEPPVIRRAKALKNVLSNIKIQILDGELLAGMPTSRIRGGALTPELNARWYVQEMDLLSRREWDQFAPVQEADRERIRQVCQYWQGESLYDRWHHMIPPPLLSYNNLIQMGGAFCGNNQYYGHTSVDFKMLLERGLLGLHESVRQRLANFQLTDAGQLDKYHQLQAARIALEGAIIYARRYAKLAADMARAETDKERRAELENLAEVCAKAPLHPAESFYEAVQGVCLGYVMFMIEAPGTGEGYLRADQYLYPYYRRDTDSGALTRDLALALIASLYIKLNASVIPYSSEVVSAFCGFALSANITLGGVDGEGQNAVNELSYLFLDAEEQVALIAEDIVVRISEKTPMDFLKRACVLAKELRGKIKFVGDRTIINQLVREGRPLELARGYAITGCNTPTLPGHSLDTPGGIINLPLFLELALNDGVHRLTGRQLGVKTGDPRAFHTFEELWEAFMAQARALIPLCSVYKDTDKRLNAQYAPLPLQSVFMSGCLDRGRDITNLGTDYTSFSMSLAGAPNVGDSLAALKKTIYEDKSLTMAEVLEALQRDFQDCARVKSLLGAVPKFGNNQPYVDQLVDRVLRECGAVATAQKGFGGADSGVAAAAITANIGLGEVVGALPDGRLAGTPISEGGISPHQGRNKSGATATLMSVAHLDYYNFTNGAVLNMRFDSGLLKSDEDYLRFAGLVRTYLEEGGVLVQFNFVSTDTLLKAQREPQLYRDLLVRVATFTSYFVELSPPLQNDIINRLEYESI